MLLTYACKHVSEKDIKDVKKEVANTIAKATSGPGFILDYTASPEAVQLFWQDDKGHTFKSFDSLEQWLGTKNRHLVFAMNAGMYMEDNSPLGLYIERGIQKRKINTRSGKGNFYLKPNGVFYITKDKKAKIVTTEKFVASKQILYATQSGPMLLVDGAIHPKFTKDSKNVTIRNGVGILPDGKILFAMSKSFISFYDFALYFKEQGCLNALYLDGGISQTYLPEKDYTDKGGNFGVMIGVTKE
ncbi:hypothetical protein DBR32_05965 [Taibaiella sp. KBW10]|nr:hypothetical protein DBR32_05965 [Taibaiella sp. KBW10]